MRSGTQANSYISSIHHQHRVIEGNRKLPASEPTTEAATTPADKGLEPLEGELSAGGGAGGGGGDV